MFFNKKYELVKFEIDLVIKLREVKKLNGQFWIINDHDLQDKDLRNENIFQFEK